MKTKVDLENNVWYRLVKVVYALFASLALGVTFGVIADEWDKNEGMYYSQKQVYEIQEFVKNEFHLDQFLALENTKGIDHKTISEAFPGIEYKKTENIVGILDGIHSYGYKISGVDFMEMCGEGEIWDTELKKFFSGGTARICVFDTEYPFDTSENMQKILKLQSEIHTHLNDFVQNPDLLRLNILRSAAYRLGIDKPTNSLFKDGDPKAIDIRYAISISGLLISAIIIELLIFLLIIPKAFFYIALGKQH